MNMQLLAPESTAWNRRMLGSLFLSALSESNSLLNAVSISSSSDSFWGGPWPAEADAEAPAYKGSWYIIIKKKKYCTYTHAVLTSAHLPAMFVGTTGGIFSIHVSVPLKVIKCHQTFKLVGLLFHAHLVPDFSV